MTSREAFNTLLSVQRAFDYCEQLIKQAPSERAKAVLLVQEIVVVDGVLNEVLEGTGVFHEFSQEALVYWQHRMFLEEKGEAL